MNIDLVIALSFSILIAAMIGLVRFKKISQTYYPFIILLWVGAINEIISFVLVKNGYSNAINNNIYYLAESILLTLQFKNWILFKSKKWYYGLITMFLVAWLIENFIFNSITIFGSYFIVLHSLIIVLLSITMINSLIVSERKDLKKNPTFIICIGLILYFTYAVLLEAFWIYGLDSSNEFQDNVIALLSFINLFTNLLYTLAVLWMRKKKGFTLSF